VSLNSIVLDASALMAILNREPGAERLTPDVLIRAVMSTVNLTEVQGKLVTLGISPDDAWSAIVGSVREAAPFTFEQAREAGNLIASTLPFGLSLGDRACLALALERRAPIYTADRAWKNLKLNIPIHVIR